MVLGLLFSGRAAEVLGHVQEEYRSGVPDLKMGEADATGAPPGGEKPEQTAMSEKKMCLFAVFS